MRLEWQNIIVQKEIIEQIGYRSIKCVRNFNTFCHMVSDKRFYFKDFPQYLYVYVENV